MPESVKFDISGALAEEIGEHGLPLQSIADLAPRACQVLLSVQGARGEGTVGFMDLPLESEGLESCREVLSKIDFPVEDLVVLGIGGSALGTKALSCALLRPLHNELPKERRRAPRLRVLDNIDPVWVAENLEALDLGKTLFYVVTKSGATAETAAQFMIVRGMLEGALGASWREHVVCATDPEEGALREIARREELPALDIPQGVGGRFSVLSPVGLFPAVVCGMDAEALLEGAAAMDERCISADVFENPALMLAALLYLFATEKKVNIHVLMPYSQALWDLADWYRQLLAESLGKRTALDGRVVNAGLTPARALGATDQHSQIQLYTEGPFDKLVTLIEVESRERDLEIPPAYEDVEAYSYLGGKRLGELLRAELRGTELALRDSGRPCTLLQMEKVAAGPLGELLMLFEESIAYAGALFAVDAFDQPGVEAGKRAAWALMGRRSFEDLREEIESRLAAGKRRFIQPEE